jgi:zinc carboxypeptidase
MRIHLSTLALCALAGLAAPAWGQETQRLQPPTLAEATRELERLGKAHEEATLLQFGRSAGKKPLLLLRIGAPGTLPLDERQAVFVGANMAGDRPLGSAAALDLARALLEAPPAERAARAALLKRVCFYVAPVLNPDAHDANSRPGAWGRRGNAEPVDADRDGLVSEDGPDDLDGDGRITQLRVPDPAGAWIPDPRRPDLSVRAEASLGEKGRFRLETEGRDQDGDGRFNEDAQDGVQPDRNFAHAFPYPAPTAGPWASSTPEAKAIMDFLLARRQVALAVVYGQANVLHELPAAGARPKGRAAQRFLPEDRASLERLATRYRRQLEARELPTKRPAKTIAGGSFAAWLYYHYGAQTLELDLWAPPGEAPAPKGGAPKGGPAKLDLPGLRKLSAEKLLERASAHDALLERIGAPPSLGSSALAARLRGGELTPNQLADRLAPYLAFSKTPAGKARARARGTADWWAQQGVAAVTSFRPVQVEGLPGATVGGAQGLEDQRPPKALGEAALAAHTALVLELADRLGRVEIRSLKLTPLGAEVYRVEVVVGNGGELATHTAMAALAKVRLPIRIELGIEGGVLVTGRGWAAHERLGGSAKVFKHTWLVRANAGQALKVEVRATSEHAGRASATATSEER